jgi:hypothetical protein
MDGRKTMRSEERKWERRDEEFDLEFVGDPRVVAQEQRNRLW